MKKSCEIKVREKGRVQSNCLRAVGGKSFSVSFHAIEH
jgi:hypothetical protein